MPLQLSRQELLVQRAHVRVALEEVVVVAVDPYAVTEIERARLSADVGPALIQRDGEALAQQLARGHESGDPCPHDGDLHRHRARGARSMPAIGSRGCPPRSRTLGSTGRALASSTVQGARGRLSSTEIARRS